MPKKLLQTVFHKGFTAADHFDDQGYWAGEGGGASGVLPVCPSKGTVCLAWRSQDVDTPDCWGTLGGAVKEGMDPQESARIEMAEEIGYKGNISLTPAYVFSDGGFSYRNYIGVLPSEFTFNPGEGHGWETDSIVWVPYADVVADMQENPDDYHPGLMKLFQHSKDDIERALGIKKAADAAPEIEFAPDPDVEWRKMLGWLNSLQWRGRNPWYPEKFPWFAVRLYSDGWIASNDLAKEQLAEGKDLGSLKRYLSEFAEEYGSSLESMRTRRYKTIDMQTDAIEKRGAEGTRPKPPGGPERVYTPKEVDAFLRRVHESNTDLHFTENYMIKTVAIRDLVHFTNIPASNPRVADYMEKYKQGSPFPPVILDSKMNVRDGSHRVSAAIWSGLSTVQAFVPIEAGKTSAAHTPEYAQKLIEALKHTVHDADFSAIGSVGAGGSSENDLDIKVDVRPDAVYADDEPWIDSSGLTGAMKLMGFDYAGPSDFSPEESAEKSETSGKYLEKFFNPTTHHTVEFWFSEPGMIKEASSVPKLLASSIITFVKTNVPEAAEIWFYGSRARGQAHKRSDWDFLVIIPKVTPDRKIELGRVGGILDVGSLVGKKVDIQTARKGDLIARGAEEEGQLLWSKTVPKVGAVQKVWYRGSDVSTPSNAWLKKAAGFAFKSFKKLWHVGTMNPKDKRDNSYEGAGLSVSVNPEEWSMVAKLPGDLWELTKPGNKFMNFHRLSKAQRQEIVKWGIKNGYAQPAELWRHSWYDDEVEDWRYSDYATKEEAEAELGGGYEEEKVEPTKGGLTATPKLSQKSKRGKIGPLEVMDLLVTAYAEDELDCDGVWWADDFDPENLSAPRGVIFPNKLSSWKVKKTA